MHFENLHFNRCLLLFWHAIKDQNFDNKKRKKKASFDNPGKKKEVHACFLSAIPKSGLLPVF